MTLLQLRYFKAVCEFHSVTKAADELFISRTAISRSINALEQELGIVLFTHTTTGLELTDDGKIIYDRINEVLGRICAIEQVVQKLAEGPKRQIVNVGLTPFTSQRIFPDFYQKFHENYPNITLAATEKNNLEARALLAEGSIDVIFTTDICYDTENCDILSLGRAEQVLYVSKQNPLAQRKSIKTEDLRLLPLAMLSKYLQRERELTSRLDSIGCPPNIVMRLSQISALHLGNDFAVIGEDVHGHHDRLLRQLPRRILTGESRQHVLERLNLLGVGLQIRQTCEIINRQCER